MRDGGAPFENRKVGNRKVGGGKVAGQSGLPALNGLLRIEPLSCGFHAGFGPPEGLTYPQMFPVLIARCAAWTGAAAGLPVF